MTALYPEGASPQSHITPNLTYNSEFDSIILPIVLDKEIEAEIKLKKVTGYIKVHTPPLFLFPAKILSESRKARRGCQRNVTWLQLSSKFLP